MTQLCLPVSEELYAANKHLWTREETDEWNARCPGLLTGKQSGVGREVVFDVEANGLLWPTPSIKKADTLWCVAAKDLQTGERFYWGVDQGPDSLKHAGKFLSECALTLGHNTIEFDYPFLEWMDIGFTRPAKAWDTLVIAKCIWPAETLVGPDMERIRKGRMPGKYLKSHSLAAWGYRTGTHKVEYSGGFDAWRPGMASYLVTGDLDGPEALWKLSRKRLGWDQDPAKPASLVWPENVLHVENRVAHIIQDQRRDGVKFDSVKARKLSAELVNLKADIERRLVETFGTWWQPLDDPETGIRPARATVEKMPEFPDVTIRRVSEKTGKELKPYVGPPLCEYSPDAPHVRVVRTTFNPSSRDHLAQRLQDVFGWKPKEYTESGKPKVDETVLSEIPDSVMPAETRKLILDYFVVTKTLGMLSKGKKSWLGLCNEVTSRIYGNMDSVGAVTRRCSHKDPNLGQVPSVKKAKQPDGTEAPVLGLEGRFGYECRELFTADDGWELTGVDTSSLELILMGHYLQPLDGGKFADRVCDPNRDAHREHAQLAGMTRAEAKTAIYLRIYGGSAFKLSLDLDITEDEVLPNLAYKGLNALLRNLVDRFGQKFVDNLDDRQRAKIAKARQIILRLDSGIEGLADLSKNVQQAATRGWLKGIDGSRVHVRKAHAALNALLQSAGAITCKMWVVRLHDELERLGYQKGRDWKLVWFVHDEVGVTHRPGLGQIIKEVAERAVVEVGLELGLRGKYRTDGKTGLNWAQVH